ncbi:MAG: GGDEF domain-containing phosphodiesterase, partial [Pseudomonadota bacterium]
ERTEQLAEIVAPVLAKGDRAELERLVTSFTDKQVAVFTSEGGLLAGTEFNLTTTPHHTVEVMSGGRVVGKLETARLVGAGLSIPLEGILGLVFVAVILAMASGAFFGGYAARGAHELTLLADDFRRGRVDKIADGGTDNFVEFRRVRQAWQRAISRVQREADDMKSRAYTSAVTGLPNATALDEALARALLSSSFDQPLALIRLEFDEFDSACEGFGSETGEQFLKEAVKRIQSELTVLANQSALDMSSALLAQTRQDGLTILLPDVAGRQDASMIARALRSAFAAPLDVEGCTLTLGISGGIAMAPEDGSRAGDLIRRADTAMRSVREDDKKGFRFYAPRLDRVAKGRLQLETEMRDGIAGGEFVPHFQPKIDFRTGRISGCEALARWQRPGGRSVSPGAFIPVAEETGLIEQIGETILRQSCQAAAGWLREGLALSLAVNVSPVQLSQPGFRDLVLSALTEAGLPPSYLELEITESMAIENPDAFKEALGPLKAMGVRLAVDDFGTGHSNLAILSRLNFDVFKIDRQFIQAVDRDNSARPIVEMILAMAESLGLETVAEGVETPAQARFLRARGCTKAQGFLYATPLPETDFVAFATAWEQRRKRRKRDHRTS